MRGFDRHNISIVTYQMGSHIVEIGCDLTRWERDHSPVWKDSAQHALDSLKADIAEIEAVLNASPQRPARKKAGAK